MTSVDFRIRNIVQFACPSSHLHLPNKTALLKSIDMLRYRSLQNEGCGRVDWNLGSHLDVVHGDGGVNAEYVHYRSLQTVL